MAEYRMQAVKFRNEIDIEPCWSKYSTKTDSGIRLSQIRIEKEINPDDEIIIPEEKDK